MLETPLTTCLMTQEKILFSYAIIWNEVSTCGRNVTQVDIYGHFTWRYQA